MIYYSSFLWSAYRNRFTNSSSGLMNHLAENPYRILNFIFVVVSYIRCFFSLLFFFFFFFYFLMYIYECTSTFAYIIVASILRISSESRHGLRDRAYIIQKHPLIVTYCQFITSFTNNRRVLCKIYQFSLLISRVIRRWGVEKRWKRWDFGGSSFPYLVETVVKVTNAVWLNKLCRIVSKMKFCSVFFFIKKKVWVGTF